MTTKATAPDPQRDRLQIIWETITRDAYRNPHDADIGVANGKRWIRVNRTLEELAAMLVNGVADTFDPATKYDEISELDTATEGIWNFIEKTLIDWAIETEKVRAARRAA